MKKLLVVAALVVAGGLQAGDNCGYEEVRCATQETKQVVTCPGCPPCLCPIPKKVVCKAVAQPVQENYCEQKVNTCGRCHKVEKHCGCKEGFMHRHHHHKDVVYVEEKTAPAMVEETRTVRTPTKRVVRN